MKRELRGKRVLITGASSGIGRAITEAAAQAGMRVLAVSRSAEPLHEVARSLTAQGHEVHVEPADVSAAADRQRVFAAVRDRLGGLDVLVNNAGIGTQGIFSNSSADNLRKVMDVNFFAAAEMIRGAVPLLTQGSEPAIVQVASMTGRRSMPFWSEYSASKFAVCGLIEALRAELVVYGIDVLLVLPGVTNTGMGSHLLATDGKMAFRYEKGMKPSYVAGQVLSILANNRAETVLGWEARWFIRANRWFPRLVDWGLARVVRRRHTPGEPGASATGADPPS